MAGGPVFQPDIYPKAMPLVDDLNVIKPPIYSLGLGWKGRYEDEIYTTYRFSDKMRELIDRLAKNAPLSCRDWYTVRVLQENGYKNCIMTGCPAWYCIDMLDHSQDRLRNVRGNKVCISDAVSLAKLNLIVPRAEAVRKRFPTLPIIYVIS